VKHHGNGDANSPLVRFELAEIEAAIELDRLQRSGSWLSFFRSRGSRHRLFLVLVLGFMMQWQGNGLVSYYLTLVLNSIGITNSKVQLEINGGTQIWSFLCAITAAQFIDRAGRRPLFLIALFGCMISYVIWTILSALVVESNYSNSGEGYGVVIMIFAFQGFYHIAGPLAPVYVQEVLSYSLRSKGNIVYQFSTTGASIFNSFANPIALAAIGWKYYIVYCCLLCVWMAVVYFTFPETRNLSLEEINLVFDPEAAGNQQNSTVRQLEEKDGQFFVEHATGVAQEV